ncbi:MAG: hypothetical protein J0M33_06725 [Anaerolineae bacterium]|nr:hypothetical protein [Anaerolineae bacterium]
MQPEKPKRGLEESFIIVDEQAELAAAIADELQIMTPEQRISLGNKLFPELALLGVLTLVIAIAVGLLVIGILDPAVGEPIFMAICGGLFIGLPFALTGYTFVQRLRALRADLHAGRVQVLEGAVHLKMHYPSRSGPRYEVQIAKRTFAINRELHDQMQDNGLYRLLYAPNTGKVLDVQSLE